MFFPFKLLSASLKKYRKAVEFSAFHWKFPLIWFFRQQNRLSLVRQTGHVADCLSVLCRVLTLVNVQFENRCWKKQKNKMKKFLRRVVSIISILKTVPRFYGLSGRDKVCRGNTGRMKEGLTKLSRWNRGESPTLTALFFCRFTNWHFSMAVTACKIGSSAIFSLICFQLQSVVTLKSCLMVFCPMLKLQSPCYAKRFF